MALEDILRSIRADTEAETREFEAASAAEIASIATRADAEAKRVQREAAESRGIMTAREVAQILDRARLDARRASLRAIESAYQDVLMELRSRLGTIRGTEGYPDVFRRLLDEGLGVLEDATRLSVDAADIALAQEVVSERGAERILVEVGEPTAGGLDLATEDGRVVRNTFESRFGRADGRLRCLVARELPDEETP